MRAARVLSLVQMGELSSARQALEAAPLAPGNLGHLGDSHRPIEETTNTKEGIE